MNTDASLFGTYCVISAMKSKSQCLLSFISNYILLYYIFELWNNWSENITTSVQNYDLSKYKWAHHDIVSNFNVIFYNIKQNFLYVYLYVCLCVPKYPKKYSTYSVQTNTYNFVNYPARIIVCLFPTECLIN